AAIAAVHDEARTADETDWPQIMALYQLLMRISDNPVVALNHAVAVAMVRGPRAGLALLADLEADQRLAAGHRLPAIRAHLLEMAGEPAIARPALPEGGPRAHHPPAPRLPAAPGRPPHRRAASRSAAMTGQPVSPSNAQVMPCGGRPARSGPAVPPPPPRTRGSPPSMPASLPAHVLKFRVYGQVARRNSRATRRSRLARPSSGTRCR